MTGITDEQCKALNKIFKEITSALQASSVALVLASKGRVKDLPKAAAKIQNNIEEIDHFLVDLNASLK